MIQLALSNAEIAVCFDVMQQLRPQLERETFVSTVRSMQKEGYHLAYLIHERRIVALAGYRIYSNLVMGRHLYVDDLVTDEKMRSKGFGKQLIDWLKQQAVEQQCQVFHLDSGTQRCDAHRFYLTQGFDITAFHFSQTVKESGA